MYTRACISFRLSPGGWLSLAVLRLTPLYDHLRIRLCPAHVPDRLPSNPLSDAGVYSRTKHQGRMARALDRGMQRVTERCERIPNSLLSLARSFLRSSVRSFAHSLVRSDPPCPFVPLYRLSWSSVHASRCTPRTRPSSVIWTLRRVIRNCMSST